VDAEGNALDARVVAYDPVVDVAILDVPNLAAQPLEIAWDHAKTGADAVVLGYPGGGEFVAAQARIKENVELSGPDVYHTTQVTRDVYTINGTVKPGVSGGPMIGLDRRVLGMVFGSASEDTETGFVLTAKTLAPQILNPGNAEPVATGGCLA
jgi:S1-C subfamily serine protease